MAGYKPLVPAWDKHTKAGFFGLTKAGFFGHTKAGFFGLTKAGFFGILVQGKDTSGIMSVSG